MRFRQIDIFDLLEPNLRALPVSSVNITEGEQQMTMKHALNLTARHIDQKVANSSSSIGSSRFFPSIRSLDPVLALPHTNTIETDASAYAADPILTDAITNKHVGNSIG